VANLGKSGKRQWQPSFINCRWLLYVRELVVFAHTAFWD